MNQTDAAPAESSSQDAVQRESAPDEGGLTNICIPPYPPDLDCTEISAVGFQVVGTDVHGFDADGDGIACDP